jgi:hypothetical protein
MKQELVLVQDEKQILEKKAEEVLKLMNKLVDKLEKGEIKSAELMIIRGRVDPIVQYKGKKLFAYV